MSKDKGSKNHKKQPADKSSGKTKIVSAYKSEGKGGVKQTTLDAFIPKSDPKQDGSKKP